MERIEKIICIDDSRSHRNGLLPFVRYGGDGSIESANGINGNYGQYVCDFCIFNEDTGKEKARLKYLDVMRNYNFVQECLREATYTKRISITEENVLKIVCDGENNVEEVTNIEFTETFPEIPELRRYDYIPLDADFFSKGKYGYKFDEPREYVTISNIAEESRTPEQKAFVDKIDDIKEKISDEEKVFFVLLPNYDEVMSINKWWNKWWLDNFKDEWEKTVFDDHYDVDNEDFKFCEDVDKYILGIVEVVGEKDSGGFNGSKVPSFVYYTNFYELKKWFEDNSGATMSAIEAPNDENECLIKEWDNRGGGAFYDFLSNKINPKWITYLPLPKEGFNYAPPAIDLEVIINTEMEYETLYSVYEYSVIDDEIVGAVLPYRPEEEDIVYLQYAYNDDTQKVEYTNRYYKTNTLVGGEKDGYKIINSESVSACGLTKQWVDLSTTSAYCESQLESLIHPSSIMVSDNIFGVYKVFDEEKPEQGKMFKCFYRVRESSQPYVEAYTSGIVTTYTERKDDDGEIIDIIETKKYNDTIRLEPIQEIPPKVDGNSVQVFGVKEVSARTEEDIFQKEPYKDKNNNEIEESYWSAITWYTYEWWECIPVDEIDGIECANGENVGPNDDTKYRSATIVSCTPSILGYTPEVDKFYYILARYDNGTWVKDNILNVTATTTLSIPYVTDAELNIMSYDGGTISYDKVLKKTYGDSSITITYAKGVTSGDTGNTGVHYEETFYYQEGARAEVPIDGVYVGELFYDVLGDGFEKEEVYSEEYRQTRQARRAKITGMEVGTLWTPFGIVSGVVSGAVNALLFTKEGADGLQEEPKEDISLLYNRGNAAAWERHFKLSECNTMEDLENYGNNFFNL